MKTPPKAGSHRVLDDHRRKLEDMKTMVNMFKN
jgi:hypothetical protein